MRRLIASSVLVAGLLAAIPAMAAAPASAPPAAGAHAAKSTPQTPADPAQARCSAAWQAQTSHTQTKAAFMAACLHHG